MAQIGTIAVQKAAGLLRAPSGLQAGLAEVAQANHVSLPVVEAAQILSQNVPAELIEKQRQEIEQLR